MMVMVMIMIMMTDLDYDGGDNNSCSKNMVKMVAVVSVVNE